MRIGIGYDIHRLVAGRRLVLGGLEIPSPMGLEGHSDADCLTHALADAVFGAAGLDDIGHWFPNTDPSLRGMDSQLILRRAVAEVRDRGWCVGNVDCVVIAELPRIGPYINEMKRILADSLSVDIDAVGIKATTNEGVGDIGRGLAIAAHASCLLLRS